MMTATTDVFRLGERNFFRVLPGNERAIALTKLEFILRSQAFQRGYKDRSLGLPRIRVRDGVNAEIDYERGRLFAACIIGHGVKPEPLVEADGMTIVPGVRQFALTFADDWDPINEALAEYQPGQSNGDAK